MGLIQSIADRIRSLGKPAGTLQGYENPELVELIFEKTKAYSPEGSWPEMTGISTVRPFPPEVVADCRSDAAARRL